MPVRETYEPYPTVGITPTAAPFQHIQSSPAAFGGATGKGLEQLGQGVETAGNTGEEIATRAAALHNDAQVNSAVSDFNSKLVDALHKPESAVGAQDGGFYTKLGDNAGMGYEGAKDNLDKMYADTLGGLANDRQRISFAADARRMLNYAKQGMGSHVDQQIHQAADAKVGSAFSALGQEAGLAAQQGDLTHFDQVVTAATGKAMEHASNRGFGDDWGKQYAAKWVGQTVANAAKQAADAGDLKTASLLVDKYGPEMDRGSVLSVETALKTRMKQQDVNAFVNNAGPFAGGVAAPAGAPRSQDVSADSGFNPVAFASHVASPSGPEGTGVNPNPGSHAAGVGQFQPSTWRDITRGEPEAAGKSEADLLAMRTDPQQAGFAERMTAKLATQNAGALAAAGLPVNDSTVYLAHFLGAQGAIKALSAQDPAAPISSVATPDQIKANPEVLGGNKTVADLRNWTLQQTAGMRPGTVIKATKAAMLAAADTHYADDPESRSMAHAQINQKFASEQLDAAAQYQVQQMAVHKAADGYIQRMMGGDFSPGIVEQIRQDPALDDTVRTHLWTMATTHAKGEVDHDVKTYGAGFYKLFQGVHAAQDDPSRITDPTQLYSHVGDKGDLTVAGVEKLTQEIAAKRTPEGEAESAMKRQFFANAKAQISGANEGLHIKDSRGDEQYLKFMAKALTDYDAGKKAGKSAPQLLDPDSPDYVGKSIKGFKRPMSQWMSDLMADNDPTVAKPDATAPDYSTPQSIVAAFQSGQLSREQAEQESIKRGFVRPKAPAPAAPSPALAPPIGDQ